MGLIYWLIIVIGVFFYVTIWLNNFPATFIQNIFEKGKTGNFDFLARYNFFVEPNPITELKAVGLYFNRLQVNLKDGKYIYKINQKREKHNNNETVEVFVMLSIGGSRTDENEVGFVFCRYKWYQWTLIDFKQVIAS